MHTDQTSSHSLGEKKPFHPESDYGDTLCASAVKSFSPKKLIWTNNTVLVIAE